MFPHLPRLRYYTLLGGFSAILLSLGALYSAQQVVAQNTPLLSGGVGFFTSTNGGNTTYVPTIAPVLAAPLGQHLLVESRANLIELFFPKPPGQSGYTSEPFLSLAYLQLDYLATSHLTVVGGEF